MVGVAGTRIIAKYVGIVPITDESHLLRITTKLSMGAEPN